MSICCPRLRSALVRVTKKAVKVCSASAGKQRSSMSKSLKSNQIRRSLAFTDAERATKSEVRCLVNCFTKEMLNDRQLYSVNQTTRLVSQICPF